jgi:glycosyltransferase involved in cell wall biosynthesis
MPELILDGVTGFLVNDIADAVAAVQKLIDIKPQACRKHASRNFSIERMIDEYISAYKMVLKE